MDAWSFWASATALATTGPRSAGVMFARRSPASSAARRRSRWLAAASGSALPRPKGCWSPRRHGPRPGPRSRML
eukprot:12643400-Alexandrium_andersonii.AAC.1